MTDEKAARHARSARNFGVLLTIWGLLSVAVAILVGSSSPDTVESLTFIVSIWGASLTLIVTGVGMTVAMHLALSGSESAHAVLRGITVVVLAYVIGWTLLFMAMIVRTSAPVAGVAMLIASVAILLVAVRMLGRAKDFLRQVATTLIGEEQLSR